MMSKQNDHVDERMFEDIRELCVCSAKAVVLISKRYNEDPRLVSKLFTEVYQKINEMVDGANV